MIRFLNQRMKRTGGHAAPPRLAVARGTISALYAVFEDDPTPSSGSRSAARTVTWRCGPGGHGTGPCHGSSTSASPTTDYPCESIL